MAGGERRGSDRVGDSGQIRRSARHLDDTCTTSSDGVRPPRPRRPDPATVAAAFAAQQQAVEAWLGARDRSAPVVEPDLDGLIALLGHTRDLHDLRPDTPPPYERDGLGIVTRVLVERLVAAAPGRSVEVRVSPFRQPPSASRDPRTNAASRRVWWRLIR